MDTEDLLTHLREKWEHSGYAPWKDDAFDLLRAAERLRDERDDAVREMESRELHHFEVEDENARLREAVEKVRALVAPHGADDRGLSPFAAGERGMASAVLKALDEVLGERSEP